MKQTIKQTTEFFATTITEAENIVSDMKSKHSSSIVNHSIARKLKVTKDAELEYFIIKVTVQHVTVKELIQELI